MFAMTFVLALHARGLASCCLNWAKDPESDQRMHMSIFCLRNNARFVALDMNPVLPGTQTKLEELLDTYGLSSFCRHQNAVDAEAATALTEVALDADWDWNGINHRIRQLASDAADYLDSAMD